MAESKSDVVSSSAAAAPLDFFPAIEPHSSGFLKVDEIHTIYWEESGNPEGRPVIVLHGGPGSGISPRHRRFFDPKGYRIISFDQRGSGQSTPYGCLKNNTTQHLVSDIEQIRELLKVERWVVWGGSWGSALSLAYSQAYPQRCLAVLVHGVFTGGADEMKYFYQYGLHFHYPEEYDRFVQPIPELERDNLLNAYHRRLITGDVLYGMTKEEREALALTWLRYEDNASTLLADVDAIEADLKSDKNMLAKAMIECHYFTHGCFCPSDQFLLKNAKVLEDNNVPGAIVHGRYDMVCPVKYAWELSRVWPKAELHIVPDAGHSGSEPNSLKQLLAIAEKFKTMDLEARFNVQKTDA